MIPFTPVKTLFSIGPFSLQLWGFFLALGIIATLILGSKEAMRLKLDIPRWRSFVLIMAIGGLIGTRVYHFVFVKTYSNISDIFRFVSGQASFGFALGLLLGYLYLRKTKLPVGRYFDSMAVPLTALIFFGRIGCHFVADHLGKETIVKWAIFYSGALRHPIAFYYILNALALFLILTLVKKKKVFDGFLFILFALIFSFMRVVLGFLRKEPIILLNLSEHQIAYFIGFCLFLILLIINLLKPRIKGASEVLS